MNPIIACLLCQHNCWLSSCPNNNLQKRKESLFWVDTSLATSPCNRRPWLLEPVDRSKGLVLLETAGFFNRIMHYCSQARNLSLSKGGGPWKRYYIYCLKSHPEIFPLSVRNTEDILSTHEMYHSH